MKNLYVLDASGYLYRSYFAIRNITNARGESTNALFGFIRSVMKLRKDFSPEHLVAVFDGPQGGKPRQAIYKEYKAHRAEMPGDLRYQIEWAKQACELMGIPILNVPEVEADDTMGSVAVWAKKHDAIVYLCTSDKDLAQLVDESIFLLNTFKDNQILGIKEVEETYGVPPNKMIDLLAMMGDTSDNIPGLPGIGPKTAAALIKQFGSLDEILKNPDALTGKKKEAVVEHGHQALLSRQLVTINTEVPFPKERDFFALKPPQVVALKDFYASMNFHSLLKELDQSLPQIAVKTTLEDNEYALVDDPEALKKLISHLETCPEIAIQTIGTDEQPIKSELIGIVFAVCPKKAWYVPMNGNLGLPEALSSLKPLLENKHIGFFGHNIKYDLLLLQNYGITITSINFDTMLASYLLNSHNRQHTLDALMLELFGRVKSSLNELLGKGRNAISIRDVPRDKLSEYCCEAADAICQLKQILQTQLQERHLSSLLYDLELPLVHVLASMERHGIYVDLDYLKKMSHEVVSQLTHLEQEIYALAGETFNLNSPKQLSQILFVKMGIHPPRKTATGFSTDVDVLETLQTRYPIAGKILEYRTLEKLRSTYLNALSLEIYPKTHRIHCTFNQSVAATGRLSCQNPNLQNIPIRSEIGKQIRGAFRPEKQGWSYLAADYSQIELRLLAHFSEDPTLIEAFHTGADIHRLTASYMYNIPLDEVTKEMRHNAKAVNFGVIYGQQAFGLSQELGIDMKSAAAFIEAYFQRYKRVKAYVEECKKRARNTGKSVTFTGRERLIPEIHSKNSQLRALAERLAVNTPLQGTAADLIKLAMLRIDEQIKKEKLHGFMILQIHDELIFEVPDNELPHMEKLVRDTMQNVFLLKIPLIVDINIGKNWAEC